MPANHSETPLAKTLNLRDDQRVWFHAMPESVQDEIGEYALDLIFVADPAEGIDAAHIFVTTREELDSLLAQLRHQIAADGHIWVSWPDQESGIASGIDERDVREAGLALGLVDTKQCEVDEKWSGLKLVIRKELR